MSVTEFGIWTNIFDYTPYFLLAGGLLPFWVTRFAARDKEGSIVTGTISQLFLAVIATIIYMPSIYFISNAIGTSQYLLIYLIAGFYVLTSYIINIFEAALQAINPQTTGYGFIIQEIVKVVVALIIILGFGEVFLGAILALVIAPAVQAVYYLYRLRDHLREQFRWGYLKQWLKGSPVFLYSIAGTQLLGFVFVLLFLYGGSEARAFYQAASSFTIIVGYASSLAISLYPKLLANSCSKEEVGLSLRTVLMLAIPLATLTMVMSVSFLTVLKSDSAFAAAWPVLVALTVDTLITMLSGFYSSILMGTEAFDAEGNISLKGLVKSKIFKLYSIPYIQAAIVLPIIYFVLTQFQVDGPAVTAVAIVAVLIVVHLLTFIGIAHASRSSIHVPIAWKSIAKYIAAAALMAALLYLLPTPTTLMATIGKTLLGFGAYIVMLLTIDGQARELVQLVWKEVVTNIRLWTGKDSGKNAIVETEN
jgi:O-antigen/teichoic acid export membrane protein